MPRILVVDDSAAVRKLVRVHLAGLGYAFEEANNGAEALKTLARAKFDLMICDLMMPVMDGIQMLRMKESMQNETPVILLTAEISDTLTQAVSSLHVVEYLKKPLNPSALRVAVTQAVELAAASAG